MLFLQVCRVNIAPSRGSLANKSLSGVLSYLDRCSGSFWPNAADIGVTLQLRQQRLHCIHEMSPSQIQFEQWVPFPVEKVFLFFANPENLPRIMPPATGTRLIAMRLVPPLGAPANGPTLAGVGSEIVTSFRVSPYLLVRAEWIAEIMEFEWNHHFADVQRRGPFKFFHHRHELTAESRGGMNGTVVRDVITYEVGFGAMGRLVDRLFVRRQMQRTFAYRQNALEKLLASQ